jgi:hypothetical protein
MAKEMSQVGTPAQSWLLCLTTHQISTIELHSIQHVQCTHALIRPHSANDDEEVPRQFRRRL